MENFSELVYKEAQKAFKKDEVPIGAIIVKDGHVVACAHNLRENNKDATAHAEVLAIRAACKKIGDWRLSGADLYVSVKPCVMCAGSIVQSRIKNVYYYAESEKDSCLVDDIFEHNEQGIKVNSYLLNDGCKSGDLVKQYFKMKRGKEV